MGAHPHVTIWRNKHGEHVNAAREMTLAELERVLQKPKPAAQKELLPLLKLAKFGELRTKKKSLRHDENVQAIYGMEGDYDAGLIPMGHAAEILSAAGLEALLYTSASHTPERPRWRVIVPLSAPLEGDTETLKAQHRHWAGVLNALLDGVLSGESFTMSQSYFFGAIEGRPAPEIIRLSGCCLDELGEMPEPIFPEEKKKNDNTLNGHGGATLDGISSGEHIFNNTRNYAARLIAKGIPATEALELMRGYLRAHKAAWMKDGAPDARWQEAWDKLPAMIEGAHDKFAPNQLGAKSEPSDPEIFEAKRLDAISDMPRPARIQKLIESASVTALVSPPNMGKTALTIDMLLHVAAGECWFNLKVVQCPTLYCAPEAPASVVMRAKAAAARKFPKQQLPFYVMAATPLIGDEDWHAGETLKLIATINNIGKTEGKPIGLAAIDTLASCLGGGDENAGGMVRMASSAKAIAAATGAAVVLVHHPSKSDSNNLRGHGSLAAACDTILAVAIDEAGVIRTATLTKSRDFATGLQLSYELEPVMLDEPDEFGDPRSTIIVKPTAVPVVKRKPNGVAQATLLADLERRHRTGETGWDLMTLRKVCRELGIHRNSHSRAISQLRTGGFLRGGDAHLTLADPPEPVT